jgi:hypothetical protein
MQYGGTNFEVNDEVEDDDDDDEVEEDESTEEAQNVQQCDEQVAEKANVVVDEQSQQIFVDGGEELIADNSENHLHQLTSYADAADLFSNDDNSDDDDDCESLMEIIDEAVAAVIASDNKITSQRVH